MLSVVVPFRDAGETVAEALGTVLEERAVPLEVLAIDDGSTDAGPSIVSAFSAADPRVRLLRSPGRGIVAALQHGLERARFPFVARMDADDLSLPGRFPAQLDALARDPRVAAIGTRVEGFPAEDVGEGSRVYLEWLNGILTPEEHARELFVESPLCHPTVVMRREALLAIGGYRDFDGPEDYDLWLRLDAAGHALAKVDEVLLRWRHHRRRMTLRDGASGGKLSLDGFARAKAPFLAARLARLGRPFAIWGAGKTGRRLARALEAHGARPTRFLDIDPRKIGGVARGARIDPPDPLVRGRETIVVAVGARGARALVRARLHAASFVEGHDFVCAS